MNSLQSLLSLKEARDLLPGKPDLSTIFRWALYGCRGVRLQHLRIGRRLYTREEWLNRFITELTARDNDNPPKTTCVESPRLSGHRAQRVERSQKRLRETGFGD